MILEKTLESFIERLAVKEVAASFKTVVNNTLYIVSLIRHDHQTRIFKVIWNVQGCELLNLLFSGNIYLLCQKKVFLLLFHLR